MVRGTKSSWPARYVDQQAGVHISGGGNSKLNRRNIFMALEGSLKRLKTDYLDLYQVHWPERSTNYFGKLGFEPEDDATAVPIEETLEILGELVKSGKVRYLGVSNETPWGVMHYLQAAGQMSLPRIVSIQNPYNLLNRSFEIGLTEIAYRENTGLLAYSPLGFGVLSGKYLDGKRPAGARLTLFPDYKRYSNDAAIKASRAYANLARAHGLDPAQMALAFVHSRPFTTSTIIGATTMTQLMSNLASIDIQLDQEVLAAIDAIHKKHPNPSP